MSHSLPPGMEPKRHGRRNAVIVGVLAIAGLWLAHASGGFDEPIVVALFLGLGLAVALLIILLLNKGERELAQESRFRAGTITGYVRASTGFAIAQGAPVAVMARAEEVCFDFGGGQTLRIPITEVLALAFGGPGTQVQSVTLSGVGIDLGLESFGVGGADVKTVTNTFVHVTSERGAVTVFTQEADPAELEAVFAEALLALRHRRDLSTRTVVSNGPTSSSRVSDLERLAALHASGAISDDEYVSEKARILGS